MLTNKQKIENVFALFLSWNLGDVRKAAHLLPDWEEIDQEKIHKIYPTYDGGAMVGTTILAMCAISSLGQFSEMEGTGNEFKWFVNKYMKPLDDKYDADELYALRCSLVKNYALGATVIKKGVPLKFVGFTITNQGSNLIDSKYGKLLNIKKFIVDIQLAAQAFFEDAALGKLSEKITKKIITYNDTRMIGPIKNVSLPD